ncbi:helix-turn-helix domain-containing protein [Streptomyces olivoreticuli]
MFPKESAMRPTATPPAISISLPPPHAAHAAFLTVKGAAEYLGLSPHTLYVWRHRRQGPPSFRMGSRGRVMYRREVLDAWIREQEQADSRSNTVLSPLSVAPQCRSSGTPSI